MSSIRGSAPNPASSEPQLGSAICNPSCDPTSHLLGNPTWEQVSALEFIGIMFRPPWLVADLPAIPGNVTTRATLTSASRRIALFTGWDTVRLGNTTRNPIAESEESFQSTREKLSRSILEGSPPIEWDLPALDLHPQS